MKAKQAVVGKAKKAVVSKTVAGAFLAAVAAFSLTGCTSNSPSPTPGAHSAASSAAGTGSGTPSTPTASTSASASATTPSTSTKPVSVTTAEPRNTASVADADKSACTNGQLKVGIKSAGVASGNEGDILVFTNTSSQTCTLQGYPGAAIMHGSATVLNATRALNGFIGDERQLSSAPVVTLAPGGTASAMLEWVVDNGEPCGPSGTGTLEVTPPNTTVTTGLVELTAGSAGICADFEIHPAVSGTFSN